jgi:glycosyltransferase involved in cell wall biosynthesis
MKVGYVIPEFPGQTHIWMWREITHLREWGADIQVFSTRRPNERDKARHAFAGEAGAKTVYLWPPGLVRSAGALFRMLLVHPAGVVRCLRLALTLPIETKPRMLTLLSLILPACILGAECERRDIEHLHAHTCSNGAILCMMVKCLIGLPYSMTLNANIEWWGGAMRQKFEQAAFTIPITRWLGNQMRRDFPTLRDDQILPGGIGVDTQRWTPDAGRSSCDQGLRLVTIGRLHPSKGHDLLLHALRRLVNQQQQLGDAGVEISLRIIGSGAERDNLESLTRELDLSSHVQFMGSLSEDEVIRQLGQADIFVLASHAEPLGVVYMEAMAMEVATIGTAAGGVGEIITDGVDGLLVPPGDEQSLADAIRRLLDDPALRHRLAEAGRRTIVRSFDSRLGAGTLWKRLKADDWRSHNTPSPALPRSTGGGKMV